MKGGIVPYADFTSSALWRRTCDYQGSKLQEASPWRACRGYRKARRAFDIMHLCHLGFIRDVIGSVLKDTLESGELQRFVQLPGGTWDECLHAWTRMAQRFAKDRKLDLYMKPLTAANCGLTQIAYPELTSRVKASKARVLLAFTCHFDMALDQEGANSHALLRQRMVWNLDSALSIFGTASRPHAATSDVHLGCRRFTTFLLSYQKLALNALQQQRLLFKLRPKLHYLQHLILDTQQTELNAMAMSNFGDEDHMKVLKSVSHACHPGKVLTSWAKRYLIKKCLLLRRYEYRPQS
ncbi:unnamed protein product [Symbiodinium sp. CCMP2592]|nr:unnamed protein product [Symbiodinium sp. CCMP2592]